MLVKRLRLQCVLTCMSVDKLNNSTQNGAKVDVEDSTADLSGISSTFSSNKVCHYVCLDFLLSCTHPYRLNHRTKRLQTYYVHRNIPILKK